VRKSQGRRVVVRYEVGLQKGFICWLIAASLLIGLASVSDDATAVFKWFRILVFISAMFFTVKWFRLPSVEYASAWLLFFSVVFVFSSLWSDDPFWALAYKGMFGVSIVTGLCLGRLVACSADARFLVRAVVVVAMISLASLLGVDIGSSIKGQLVVGGLNPNAFASVVMVFFVFSLFSALTERDAFWKVASVFCVLSFIVLMFFSGSRAGALVVVGAGGILVLLLVKFDKLIVTIFIFVLFITFFIMTFDLGYSSTSNDGVGFRLLEKEGIFQETRLDIWSVAWSGFFESPLIGIGWTSSDHRWTPVLSMYLQVLAETGIMGFSLLVILTSKTIRKGIRLVMDSSTRSYLERFSVMVVVLLCGLLMHGFFESSMLLGTTPHTLLFAFAVIHIDLMINRKAVRQRRNGV
jgi:O-antigen ligase